MDKFDSKDPLYEDPNTQFTITSQNPSSSIFAVPSSKGDVEIGFSHLVSPLNSEGGDTNASPRSPNDMDYEENSHTYDSHESLDQKLSKMSEMQKRFYYFFEEPTGRYAKSFQALSYLLLLAFTVIFLIETLPQYTDPDGQSSLTQQFVPFETFITMWWLIELLGRFYASVDKIKFFTRFQNIIDIITILPYFMSFIPNNTVDYIARILRLLRIAKILQLTRYSTGVTLASKAMKRSTDAIITLFVFLLASTMVASSCIFWVERGIWDPSSQQWKQPDGRVSNYQSIPESFYWAMVTLSTVGYGDVVPITPLGKLVATLTMVISILTIALPTSIIGSNFMAEWQIYQKKQLQKKMQKRKKVFPDTDSPARSIKKSDNSVMREQNSIMLQTIAEIQDRLSDIHPPQYYTRYKESELKIEKYRETIYNLEKKVLKLKKELEKAKKGDKEKKNKSAAAQDEDVTIVSSPALSSHYLSDSGLKEDNDNGPRNAQSMTKSMAMHLLKSTKDILTTSKKRTRSNNPVLEEAVSTPNINPNSNI